MDGIILVALPYTAVSFAIVARFIFLYLLYTKKSTNIYSLTFCCLSVISSILWIPYGVLVRDTPIIIRSSIEITLLSISGTYIIYNRHMVSRATTARLQDAVVLYSSETAAAVTPVKD